MWTKNIWSAALASWKTRKLKLFLSFIGGEYFIIQIIRRVLEEPSDTLRAAVSVFKRPSIKTSLFFFNNFCADRYTRQARTLRRADVAGRRWLTRAVGAVRAEECSWQC